MLQSVEKQIIKSISNHKRGKIFFPSSFSKFGSSTAVRQALNRLEDKGDLIRLAKGIYLYPKTHDLLGILMPTIEEIAKAIAKRDKARIIPTGAMAVNKLGLSTQVPMNVVYLTDGTPRKITVNGGSIKFRSASPNLLAVKDDTIILIIQALREIGKDKVKDNIRSKLKQILSAVDSTTFDYDLRLAPVWIQELIKEIITEKK